GAIDCVDKDYFEFQYRHSNIKLSSELILSAAFRLSKGNKADIAMKIAEHRNKRSVKHPISLPSAGSFFKNFKNPVVEGQEAAAGWYLEQVGAKDLRVGDAGVFEKHANIFVNYGNASAGDVLTMASELKDRVLDKFNMDLYMEVRPVGDFGQFGELLDNLEYKNL
ncbi:MAG: hypothetical protein GY855_04135, partial [candidate division Zixibacteria bacterium]|nr:hypothetical protein [candidate division Zixibacteria bacterium]